MEDGIYILAVWLNKLPSEIGELSMVQFSELIYQLSRKINWEVHLAALPAGNELKQEFHPLAPDTRTVHQERGAVKTKDTDLSFDAFEEAMREFVRRE